MSAADPSEAPAMPQQTSMSEQPAAFRKSYRRKYRKIMVTFEEKTRESTSLFKEEQRILDISQRLAEQTDQLLQLLVDLNSCPQVPPRLRYDLKPPSQQNERDGIAKEELTEEEGHLRLRKARYQLQTGEIDAKTYWDIESSLLDTLAFTPERSYTSLLELAPPPMQNGDKTDPTTGTGDMFLSIRREEQYLQSLDAFLDGTSTNPRSHTTNSLGSRNAEKTTDREREMQLKNPVSIYNWLRKHQPQVFLQDNEPGAEKATRATGSRSSARKSVNKEALKQEPELYDDDGVPMDVGSSARGKRKREDDGGYRPKGGNSRGTKRKKETKEDSGRNKRAKKLSVDAR
ncbi:IEC3 subunit of the Ino80 complex, chromatin re-modelling-domain-containing protein [Exophiala viscosa]|uniref:IEC3 subunit of the Ino80 complex, chromatin re-modelling-domain-containing protein n=1 Tax=Exophiala viscosa TaxID=2486360 RepID=A0AAN6DN69_9EURO|nr:IEC3 subunit of the Ino80 complex, chromatin re-modelling-domain-containing protein [Exophiala viscosa]KAI1619813.1 IEC3 subunit of the Ino80 complex, chromatin re-modelling-domain-containing protein [Exophiala viscosa]